MAWFIWLDRNRRLFDEEGGLDGFWINFRRILGFRTNIIMDLVAILGYIVVSSPLCQIHLEKIILFVTCFPFQ